AEVFIHRKVAIKAEGLVHIADGTLDSLRVLNDIVAVNRCGAAGRFQQAAQHPNAGALPAAVRTKESEYTPLLHVERKIIHSGEAAEFPSEALQLDGFYGHWPIRFTEANIPALIR